MLYVLLLPEEEKQTLQEGHRNGKKKWFRDRCQSILLSSEGFEVKELSRIYKVRTRTIYTWIHCYESAGILGLKIVSGRGLKAQLNTIDVEQEATIKAEIGLNPQNLRDVATILSEKFGFAMTKSMLKKYIKKN